MGVITGYPADSGLSDDDNFLGPNNAGVTSLYPASLVNKYMGPGWTIASDTWTFSSYNSTTGVGVITTTSGATTRYSNDMWIRFTQPTLGTKYAKITAVATSTITAKFYSGTILSNEAISNMRYSTDFAPYGVDTSSTITPTQMLGVDLFGTSGVVSGSSPPSAGTGQFYMQAGSAVGSFALNAFDFTFPTPFPNGVITVIITNGDNNAGTNPMTINGTNYSVSGFRAQSQSTSTQRVNWIAIGW